jgi:DNA repair protein RecN (Recombination protein N)
MLNMLSKDTSTKFHLKTLTVGDVPGKTLIFDEVDAGIGGRVAEVVGGRLRALGDRFQVLCITHLPQIAARGAAHFRIEKQVRRGRTLTTVARMSDELRVEEIGRMIGGATVTEAARSTAYDLLRGRPEAKGERERRMRLIWPGNTSSRRSAVR